MGDSDCLPPVWHRSGCPRSTIPPQRPQPSLQQQEDAPTTGPDCGSAVARTVYFLGGDDRPSQVPGGPQCAHAPLSDPGGHTTPGLYSAALLPSGLQTPSAPTMSRISGLNHAAWTLAVYASPQQLPTAAQDSLPAGGQPLPGGLNGPLGPSRNFMAASMPPIPSDQASPGAPEGPPYACSCVFRQFSLVSSGLSRASICARCGSRNGGRARDSPRLSRGSSASKPGPSVASSMRMPLGSRK